MPFEKYFSKNTRCAPCDYQSKDSHNLSQSQNFISIRERGKGTKNNSENSTVRNKIHDVLSKSFVHTVTFVWKGVPSSEITQITDNLMKKGLQQVIFMDCGTF